MSSITVMEGVVLRKGQGTANTGVDTGQGRHLGYKGYEAGGLATSLESFGQVTKRTFRKGPAM